MEPHPFAVGQVSRNPGVLFHPGQKQLGGDADGSSQAADRKILAVGEIIGRRGADAQKTLYIGHREVVFSNEISFFIAVLLIYRCGFLRTALPGLLCKSCHDMMKGQNRTF